jgi:hypothetical protein
MSQKAIIRMIVRIIWWKFRSHDLNFYLVLTLEIEKKNFVYSPLETLVT